MFFNKKPDLNIIVSKRSHGLFFKSMNKKFIYKNCIIIPFHSNLENFYKLIFKILSYFLRIKIINMMSNYSLILKGAKNITIISVRQDKPLGLGHAILCAKKILDYGESFCVILPDEFLVSNHRRNDLELMIENFHETSHGQILVEKVKRQLVTNYGIVDINTKLLLKNKSELINGMIEKPSIQKAPSNYRVIGRYILPYEILKILDKEKPAKDGEIQLTDALQKCINQKKYFFDAYQSNSTVYDCGSIKGFLGANIAIASKDKEIKQYLMKNFS